MLSSHLLSARSEYSTIQLKTENDVISLCDTLSGKIQVSFSIYIDQMKCEKMDFELDNGLPSSVLYSGIVLKDLSHLEKFKSNLVKISPCYLCTIYGLRAVYTSRSNDVNVPTQVKDEIYCEMAPQCTNPVNFVPQGECSSSSWGNVLHSSRNGMVYETQL